MNKNLPSFSIITSVWNNVSMVPEAVNSVASQQGVIFEHIIIDGNSSDGTKEYLENIQYPHMKFKSEEDRGIYDALNKGLALSSNDIVGLLHSDDLFAYENVLQDVGVLFSKGADIVYADLNYVKRLDTSQIIRYWRSGPFDINDLQFGWMPPHPTFFFRRAFLDRVGFFDLKYRIAADYDHMLRFLTLPDIHVSYLPKVVTLMRIGGESNKSLKNIIRKSSEDYDIAQKHFPSPMGTLICKNLRKLGQFF